MTFTAKDGMSIYDIAFMCYGAYDILKLINENPWITDVNYSEFAGKTITYTSDSNNVLSALNLTNKIASTGIVDNNNYVWDGTDDIWDGTNDLTY
ncbi:hypothetical protein UFOVP87_3 [uncultured Caudovirales phage]|uniref:LysM domain-containing protein n=1 Tax=uncultured Caudovirales phage TaxID=2100421 RepID=A0A6J5KZF7_9CAUD|nr:hypothetical protein UFOVP87_3 [uncultured Caudovirales phage]